MIKEKTIFVGRIAKKHGVSGEMLVILNHDFNSDIYEPSVVFFEIDGLLVPFYPSTDGFRFRNDESILLKIDGYNTQESINEFMDLRVAIHESDVIEDSESAQWVDIIGYTVTDLKTGTIGQVEEILEIPGNRLIQIKANGKEILLPYNEHIVKTIDNETKQLHVEAPEGLLDLYQ